MTGRAKRQGALMEPHEVALAYLERRGRERREPRDDDYPESDAVHHWQYRDTACTIVRCDWYEEELQKLRESGLEKVLAYSIQTITAKLGNLQGYARFNRRPLYERSYHGIVTYVPAPGGITFAQQYTGGIFSGTFVYGYDTAHILMDGVQYKDVSWHVLRVEYMVDCIKIARRLERQYRDAWKQDDRIRVIQEFARRCELIGHGKKYEITDNYGLMMNLLSGRI